ncbi:MAG TPA: hypothetical protein PLZ84_00305 [Clostridia bacterium]|nr:hypothetical protein [Clostridia bacterium]
MAFVRNSFARNNNSDISPVYGPGAKKSSGEKGPQGPAGPPGPPGPPGPSFNNFAMIHNANGGSAEPGGTFIFDSVDIASGIVYSSVDGTFTVPVAGQYFANWWINLTNQDDAARVLSVDLVQVSPFVELISRAVSSAEVAPNVSDILVGTAIINADAAYRVYTLRNSGTGTAAMLPQNGYSGVLTVIRFN